MTLLRQLWHGMAGAARDPHGPAPAAAAGHGGVRAGQRRAAPRGRVPGVEGEAAAVRGLLLESHHCAGHAQDPGREGCYV